MISFSINSLWFNGTPVKEKLNFEFVRQMEQAIEAAGAAPESHRIYWLAWLPTYPSNLFEVLEEHRVSVPLCENFRIYWDELDEERPFEALALKCLKNPFIGSGARRVQDLETVAEDYAIDGALLFATPSCRHANAAHRFLRDKLMRLGVPLLTLDMDISDPRGYSPEHTRARLEEFVEILDQRRD